MLRLISIKGRPIVLFFTFLVIMNCSSLNTKTSMLKKKPPPELKNGNHYYHYTESQLQKKKGNIDKAISYMKQAIIKDPESIYLKNELAILYLHKNDYDNALDTVEKLLEKYPDNLEGLILLGSIKQSLKQYGEAISAFEKVIAKDPERKKIYLFLGSIYMFENKLEKAKEVYRKMVDIFPDSYIGYYFLGKISLKQDSLTNAEKNFSKALDIEPMLLEPRFELLKIYKSQEENKKNKEKIIKAYKDILEQYPQNVKAAMELGVYYHKNRMKKQALSIFSDLGNRSVDEKNIFEKVVVLYIKNKKFKDAITILEGMLHVLPENSEIHYFLGISHDSIDNKDKAITHFLAVRTDSASFENASIYAAYLLQAQKKTEEAIQHLENSLKKLPESIDLYLCLGQFYENSEKYEKSEAVLKQGIEINKDNTQLLFRLGVIYDKWKKKDSSIDVMKKVININPDHAQALNYLGYTFLELGQNLDEAERLILKAIQLKPKDGYITDSLGWVYYKKGEFQKAVEILEEAISLVPDDPIILEHLGDAYLKLKNKKNALKYYKRSLSIKKEDTENLKNKIKELSE